MQEAVHSCKHAFPRLIAQEIRSHVVLLIAIVAAAVTCFFVPPDADYAGYFDLDTLSCLFCTLAVVSALLLYDVAYLYFMIFNLALLPVLFLLIERVMLWRLRKEVPHEE